MINLIITILALTGIAAWTFAIGIIAYIYLENNNE
jgi:hypothetical protein